MTWETKKIEKKWMEGFLNCALVEQDSGAFLSRIAFQLFYGKLDDTYPENFPKGFLDFFSNYEESSQEDSIKQLLEFLHIIGFKPKEEKIIKHLEIRPTDYAKLFKNCYYIFKTLAHYGETFDVNRPFKDIGSNVYFLLRIESGESLSVNQLPLFEDLELPELYSRFASFPEGYEKNEVVLNLFKEIEGGNESFFISGKAGTGKSTFIQYFTKTTKKKVLKLAFTGIASINVGGQTIHSFFLFPLKPMLPEDDEIFRFKEATEKYKIIKGIDTIIIDEVSMLRSDVLEAIDYSLRINGGNPYKRFGGKQILFVGDVFQLPPVVNKNDEVEQMLFTEEYKSEYFFDSPAYKEIAPKYFEFEKSYRQKDDLPFVHLLDEVRTCKPSLRSLELLNERFHPNFIPNEEAFMITLSATNFIANAENQKRLQGLPFTSFKFEAKITGDFKEDKYPTSQVLELKKFAQVIFIKNDGAQRWVNGTIAKVDFISQNLLEIRLQNGEIHKLEPVTWENRKYRYNRETRKIVSEVVGTFTQYAIKMAWAITIHKSQGLSFDQVVIDLGTGAFVNGQVYTALSRCRKLEGIVLKRKLKESDILADNRLLHFYQTEQILKTIIGEVEES
ncbi:MAG: AAA family ATPase [Bacteroidia bacterium]|nr:AAA family ATPase [Bacteroidia bacterium]MCF8445864.1 AAA family ATPase [Bacteroidia bacterium]